MTKRRRRNPKVLRILWTVIVASVFIIVALSLSDLLLEFTFSSLGNFGIIDPTQQKLYAVIGGSIILFLSGVSLLSLFRFTPKRRRK